MIYKYDWEENNIIHSALEYWAYPTHRDKLIEALEEWASVMEYGGDYYDKHEAQITRKLIEKIKGEQK